MMLNLKDPEVYALARQISELTGETLTAAVKASLQERYDRLRSQKNKPTVDELMAIGKRAAAHLKRPYLDHADLLYDENGLPK